MVDVPQTAITRLGDCGIASPLTLSNVFGDGIGNFVPEGAETRLKIDSGTLDNIPDISFEKAGPRENIHFNPAEVHAAIITCGGLCPGLNSVIRSAVLELSHNYGVNKITGYRYGYRGLGDDSDVAPMKLNREAVDRIHYAGGSVLGSSRGARSASDMVSFLEKEKVNILLCIGGDGTQKGAHAIATEALSRGLDMSIIGIPKTIDNDIQFVSGTFGYLTAIDMAKNVLTSAHNEAKSAYNGVGLVKVMGRDSGFIACGATLSSQEVNFCLIPEIPFTLDGKQGLLELLGSVLQSGVMP